MGEGMGEEKGFGWRGMGTGEGWEGGRERELWRGKRELKSRWERERAMRCATPHTTTIAIRGACALAHTHSWRRVPPHVVAHAADGAGVMQTHEQTKQKTSARKCRGVGRKQI